MQFEIIYDYNDEHNIVEKVYFDNWLDFHDYIQQMRENGCYNISASAIDE